MKPKTIKAIVDKKFTQWVNSITDENVRKMVSDNTILTGGSIASMLLNEDVNDYDFYFRNKETTKAVAEYYVAKFKENPPSTFVNDRSREVPITVSEVGDRIKIVVKSAGIASENGSDSYQYFEGVNDGGVSAQNYVSEVASVIRDGDGESMTETEARVRNLLNGGNPDNPINDLDQILKTFTQQKQNRRFDYRPIFLTTNAITLSNQVQIVVRFYGEPSQIHENYDFVHCTNYWSSWDREIHLNPEALVCLLSRELKYIGSKYPLASIFRTRKFIRRGWTITAGQMLKIMMQIKDLNLNDVSVLEDQLIGVDIAYFHELINKLKDKCGEVVDQAYLITLIDEIF
jgi:hypothetical protein